MRALILAAGAALSTTAMAARQPPADTEVFLAGLGRDVAGAVHGPVVNVSHNPGYDNQPSFTPDGRALLFTSNRDGTQTDIYRCDLKTKVITQLTNTPESEYSPLVTPDGKTFSVIRVEADNTQRLWRFDLDGSNPRVLLEHVKGVGYHVWLDATHLALFVVGGQGKPNTLQLADTTTGKADTVDVNPGRSLLVRPGLKTLTYVSKSDRTHWVVKELDPKTRRTTTLADAVPGSEDLAWDPSTRDGVLLTTSGSKIMKLTATGWTEAGDLASEGVGHLTRLAVNGSKSANAGERLAFVAEPVRK